MDLATFTEKILNENLHFLCSAGIIITYSEYNDLENFELVVKNPLYCLKLKNSNNFVKISCSTPGLSFSGRRSADSCPFKYVQHD